MNRRIQWTHLAAGWVGLSGLVLCGGGLVGYVALTGYRGDMSLTRSESGFGGGQMVPAPSMDAPGAPPEAEEAPADGLVGGRLGSIAGADRRERMVSKRSEVADKGGRGDEPAPTDEEDEAGEAAADVALRQWFPEAFLWAPRVTTDAAGTAALEVHVPDQLTTWRVLGLAHDRSGHQAGALATFDTRMPVYVDPVVPGWLHAGDRVVLPVQAVNTTAAPLAGDLQVDASGPLSGGGTAPIQLAAGGTEVRYVALAAEGSGTARVESTLRAGPSSDASAREIPVQPTGRPVLVQRGGTLSSSRVLGLKGPEGADPRTQELTVRVFPGPLSVLQAEVERLGSEAAAAGGGAYGLALVDSLEALAAGAGSELDPRASRRLRLVAWQRLVRAARSPDAADAADLLHDLSVRPEGPVAEGLLADLERRLVRVLVDGQRGDGTWSRRDRATIQEVLVQTALAARALPPSESGARRRAPGALERHAREVKDPYTAAVLLSTGLVSGSRVEQLRALVDEAITTREDGSRTVVVPAGARNPWGAPPTHAEMLAWVALSSSDPPVAGDLVAELMGGYDARGGFGAGPADAVALEAVVRALPGLDREVQVVLRLGEREVGRATVDPRQPLVPAVLLARPGGSDEELSLVVEPPVPGLAWVAQLASWVPWTGEEVMQGVEVEVQSTRMTVGRESTITLSLSAPSGVSLAVEQGLPAGTAVDEARLASLAGQLVAWEVHPDSVRLVTRAFQAGELIELPLVVRPAFAGRFSTGPLVLEHGTSRVSLAPLVWEVGAT